MVFSSSIFIFAFLPVCLAGYYLLKGRQIRNMFLLIMSLIFYAWGEPKFIIILIASILLNYICAIMIDNNRNRSGRMKIWLFLDVFINLGILFLFKYLMFTVTNIDAIFGLRISIPEIALPIGISFFTFQALSYVLDVYSDSARLQKSIFDLALYIALFPQLIAGPIVRYSSIEEQLSSRKETPELFVSGVKRFIIGVSKKAIISNTLAVMVDDIFLMDSVQRTVLLSWVGAICYCLQLYYDFSGYSDMAIGLGRMFGFEFEENFNYPYISRSIGEYWTRWHISLSEWFRDYLYTPLMMKFVRKGWAINLCNFFALFITWFLCGIWHGAAWNYFFYGVYYFIFIYIERVSADRERARNRRLKIKKKPETLMKKILSHIYTLSVVIFGQMIFRSTGISSMVKYFSDMIGIAGNQVYDSYSASVLMQYLPVIITGLFFCLPIAEKAGKKYGEKYMFLTPVVYTVLFIAGISFVVSSTYNPFIYFNF